MEVQHDYKNILSVGHRSILSLAGCVYMHVLILGECVCVHVCTSVCTCVRACARVYECVHVCTSVCTCVRACARVYECVHVCTSVCTCVRECAYTIFVIKIEPSWQMHEKASGLTLQTGQHTSLQTDPTPSLPISLQMKSERVLQCSDSFFSCLISGENNNV